MPDLNYQRRPARSAQQIDADRAALWDWLTPLLMICGSAAVLIAVPLFTAGTASRDVALRTGLIVLVAGVARTILAVAVAVGCSMVFGIGFDSLGRGTLRLAAVAMTATAASAVVAPAIGIFSIFVYGVTIAVLLMTLMDLDWGEAKVFAIAFVVVEIVASFVLVVALR